MLKCLLVSIGRSIWTLTNKPGFCEAYSMLGTKIHPSKSAISVNECIPATFSDEDMV